MISVEQADKNRYDEIAAFYKNVGYGLKLGPSDTVLEACDQGKLVGVTRLAEENGVLVLRGMFVEGDSQRQGVGSLMLEAASREIGSRECWCIPYHHLSKFYAQIRFQECAQEVAPKFLGERARDYRKSGRRVIVMRREPWL